MKCTKRKWFWIVGGLAVASVLAVAFLPLLIAWHDGSSLAGWSSYGQTFGIVSGFFAAIAFIAALYTIRLQQQQTAESNAHSEKVMGQLQEQTARMKQTAEIHALAAILETCERYRNISEVGEKKHFDEAAKEAMQKLKEMLSYIQHG